MSGILPDDDEACGRSFDHDLSLIGECDGMRVYECRRCGAEVWEDDESQGGES